MKQNRRTAFILAAGLGTRLKELTSDKPKALVTINEKPLLKVTLESLISQGFNHFVVNIHHFGGQIVDFLNSENWGDVEVEISDERAGLMDTGGAVLQALPYFSDSEAVLVHNVDVLTDIDLKPYYDEFVKSEDSAWILTQERNNSRKLVFDKYDNFVGRYNTETQVFDGGDSLPEDSKLLSFSGIHIFKPKYFKTFKLKPRYIFELYQKLEKAAKFTGYAHVKSKPTTSEYWFDLGTQEQLKNAEQWLSSNR